MKAAFAVAALAVGVLVPVVDAPDAAPMRAPAPSVVADAGDRWAKGAGVWRAPVRVSGSPVGEATVEGMRVAISYGDPFVCEELNRGLDVVWANAAGTGTMRFRAHGSALVATDGNDVIAAMRAGATTFAVSDACGTETTFSVARLADRG